MSERPIKLTRRRVLGSLVTVGGAGAAAGAGTMAAFSDTENSSDNVVQTGTLNLTLDDDDAVVRFFDDQGEIVPGEYGSDSVKVANEGTIAGELAIELTAIRSLKKNGKEGGELDRFLYIQGDLGGDPIFEEGFRQLSSVSPQTLIEDTLGGGQSSTFTLEWEFRTDGDTKSAKEHSVELDLTFRLDQLGGS